nr:hypothetical protein [uncultured bacterium]
MSQSRLDLGIQHFYVSIHKKYKIYFLISICQRTSEIFKQNFKKWRISESNR